MIRQTWHEARGDSFALNFAPKKGTAVLVFFNGVLGVESLANLRGDYRILGRNVELTGVGGGRTIDVVYEPDRSIELVPAMEPLQL